MVEIDVYTAYAACGGAALLSAATVQLASIDDPGLKIAIRTWTIGFVILAAGLLLFLFFDVNHHESPIIFFATQGTMLGTSMFAWGFRQLNGQASNPVRWWLLMGCISLLLTLAYYQGSFITSLTFAAIQFLVGCSILYDQRHFIEKPLNMAERALGLFFVVYTLSWGVRVLFVGNYAENPQVHLMNLPEPLLSVYMVSYGGLPLLLALFLLSVVNARLYAQVHSRALTDELTGLLTRRALRELAPTLLAKARAEQRNMAVLMLDLDHFKGINDHYGHGGGDNVLRHTAKLLKDKLRSGELLIRFGGEEFLLLIPVDNAHTMQLVAQRLCNAIGNQPCVNEAQQISVTVSIGAAMIQEDQPLDQALMAADAALYRAKEAGRNRVEMAEP
jgi:diguanylate cyclase (GGDEF)-like protein